MNIPNKITTRDGGLIMRIRDTTNDIIDYLKSLQMYGDGKTIKVHSTSLGTTISAVRNPTKSASNPPMFTPEKDFNVPVDINRVYAWTQMQLDNEGCLVSSTVNTDGIAPR